MTSDATAQRTPDELVFATQAVISWIQQSQFPIEDKFVFRNNIIRTLLAINRREAEIRQVGKDTRLECIVHHYSEIYEAHNRFNMFSAPPYTEWYIWPQAIDNYILEQKRKLWLRLKAWHKRNKRRKEL